MESTQSTVTPLPTPFLRVSRRVVPKRRKVVLSIIHKKKFLFWYINAPGKVEHLVLLHHEAVTIGNRENCKAGVFGVNICAVKK